jgi:hypothetical protein
MASDPAEWAAANPGLGIRITAEHIEREQRSMDPRTFAVERLGVGDWPTLGAVKGQGLDPSAFDALADVHSAIDGPVWFAFDIKPDRSWASIAAAGARSDDLKHIEVVEHRRGTGWVVDRLVELVEAHVPIAVLCDQKGPGMSLVSALENVGIDVRTTTTAELGQACGNIFDAVEQKAIRHLGTPELRAAVRGAVKRPLGDAWAFSRRSSAADISPLMASTLAHWGALNAPAADNGGFFFEVFS